MNSQPRVQVRSPTRSAPKNSGAGGNVAGFGIDLAEPPTPDGRIIEQPRSTWPAKGRAPQSADLPDGAGTGSEPLLVQVGEVLARNEPPSPAPLPPPGRTMYNTPSEAVPPARQTSGWGFAK
jgi:hypothetical protein